MESDVESLLSEIAGPTVPMNDLSRQAQANASRIHGKCHELNRDIEHLENQGLPVTVVSEERPWHRLALWMALNGRSNKQIAEACSVSVLSVATLRKQPWFREKFIHFSNEIGREQVIATLNSEVANSINTLIEIRDNDKAPINARRAAADSILDRALGKATVHVQTQKLPDLDQATEDYNKLKAEYEENERKMSALGLTSNN